MSKGKNVGQALFSNNAARRIMLPEVAAEVGVEVAVKVVVDPTVTMLGRETRGQRMLMLARVKKVAAAPPPPSRPSPNQNMIR